MPLAQSLDAITVDHLRSTGAQKWSVPGDVIGAFVAEMDYGTSPAVAHALRGALEKGSFGYTSSSLAGELQEATAQRLDSAHDWSVQPQDVHAVPDVISVLERTIELTTDPGTPVVVPTPAYMHFFYAIRGLGRGVIEVPMMLDADGIHRMDLPAIQDAITRSGAQLVVLCNPHNPTGRVLTVQELTAFSEVIEATGARVFADEIWAPLVFSGHTHVPYASLSPRTAAHCITAISASKGWNIPGLKCAQAVLSNDRDRAAWDSLQPPTWHRVAQLGVIGATAAYRDDSGWIDEVTEYVHDCTTMVANSLAERVPQARMSQPEGTYVCWIDASALDMPQPVCEHLQSTARVLPTDGISCGEAGRDHIRLIAAMPRPVLQKCLDRLTQELALRCR